jgi:hypothetical protein
MVFSYRNSIIHVFFMMEMGVGILFKKEMWDFMKELMVVSFVAIGLIAFRIFRMYMESSVWPKRYSGHSAGQK